MGRRGTALQSTVAERASEQGCKHVLRARDKPSARLVACPPAIDPKLPERPTVSPEPSRVVESHNGGHGGFGPFVRRRGRVAVGILSRLPRHGDAGQRVYQGR